MDTSLYRAAMEGNIQVLIQNKDRLESHLTPNNNTLLHVATQFGRIHCVMEILNLCPSMYRRANSRGDTPLHVAAREGHSTIVRALIEYANALDEELESGVGTAREMMRMSNADGDTALHEAVRNHHAAAVQLLTKEDAEFCHPGNGAGETPLYLAVERRYVGLVFVILETCRGPAYGGPGCRTALHSAVIHNLEVCTRKLLVWKPALALEADLHGWTPLHYAARFGYVSRARQLLNVHKSVAYTVDKDDKSTPLHIAASHGHLSVIQEIILHCPDCWEIVDGRGRNILHLAVKSEKKRVIKFILQKLSLSSLVNQKDFDGNTPLHLLAASDFYDPFLINHAKVDRMAFNKDDSTPLDVAYSDRHVESWGFTRRELVSAGAIEGRRDVMRRDKTTATSTKHKRYYPSRQKVVPMDMRKTADARLIVTALIAIATFSAGFTVSVPSRLLNGKDEQGGMEDLARKAAFRAFVVADGVAFILSTTAVFVYLVDANDSDGEKLLKRYKIASFLTVAVVGAMVVAFVTGMYLVLEHSSTGLAIALCVLGCFSFPFNYFLLRKT